MQEGSGDVQLLRGLKGMETQTTDELERTKLCARVKSYFQDTNRKPTVQVGFRYCYIICPWGEA
ncbi:hypothetical protein CCL22_11990 [Pseudomonas syringae]|nr:hypothetical protein CCL22_11990 [Pseudomonas syringae]